MRAALVGLGIVGIAGIAGIAGLGAGCTPRSTPPTSAAALCPPAATSSSPPPATAAAPAAPATPPQATDAEVIRQSHELLAAWDRGDVEAAAATLAPEFLHVEGSYAQTRAEFLRSLGARKPGAPYIASRTWDNERVWLHADRAVFSGKATERQGGNDAKGGYKYVGWYLVEWRRHDLAWQATLWTWQRAGEQPMREEWNEIYRNGLGFRREPNRLLVETVRGRRPGRALDVATGQGRNAVYLAAQGWKVTGVDLSDEGLRLAREQAAQRKLALDTVNANLDDYDFGKDRWDLVTMIYAGDKVAWLDKIRPSLRRGGLLVVEYFAKDASSGAGGDGFAPGQLAKLFAEGFDVVRDEVVEDAPDWAMDRALLVRFVARKR
ncbi:MAG: methyltransferase domain-containing protein [Myxococcales bacterium]|nr:methyltransferase domain-containing protein [Myxococcales bacterium]